MLVSVNGGAQYPSRPRPPRFSIVEHIQPTGYIRDQQINSALLNFASRRQETS
jgi:hypothetical protein